MVEPDRTKEQILKEVEKLRQELETVKRDKHDLEILLETTTIHADTIEELLFESNQKLQVEIVDRLQIEAALETSRGELRSLLSRITQYSRDLEIVLETTTEHGDFLENLLHEQCSRDPLTNLFNRRYLDKSLEREISRAQSQQRSLGLIMLDVDRFKQFNNTFGHDAGDLVLQELGLFLQRNLRLSDLAYRYGGEEFLLVLPDTGFADTTAKAEEIRLGVKRLQVEYLQQSLGITLSLGVACYPDRGATVAELLKAADRALYRAKTEGRDRTVGYTG